MAFNANLVGSFDEETIIVDSTPANSLPTLYESNMKSMFGNVLNQSETLSGYDDIEAERENDRIFFNEILCSSNPNYDTRIPKIPLDCGYSADVEESTSNDLELDSSLSRDIRRLSICEPVLGEDLSNSNNCKSASDLEEDDTNSRTYRKGSVNWKTSRVPTKTSKCVGIKDKQIIRKSKSKSGSKIPVRTPEGSKTKLNCLKRNISDNLIFDQQHKANDTKRPVKKLFSTSKVPKLPDLSMKIDHHPNKNEVHTENRSFNNCLTLDNGYTNQHSKPRENRAKETHFHSGGIIFQTKIPKLPDISMATPIFSPSHSAQAENRSFNNCTLLEDGYPSPSPKTVGKSFDNFQSTTQQTLDNAFDDFQSQSLQTLEKVFDNFRVTASVDDIQSNVGDDITYNQANTWFDKQQVWQDTDVLHTMNHMEYDISDREDDFDNLSLDFCENNRLSPTDFNANQQNVKNITQVRMKVPANGRKMSSETNKTNTKSNALPKHIIELLHSNDHRLVSLPAVTYMGRTGVDAFNDIENLRGQILEKKKNESKAADKIKTLLEGREKKKVSQPSGVVPGASKLNQFDHIGDKISTGIGLTISGDLKGKLSNLPQRSQERGFTPSRSPRKSQDAPKTRMAIDEVFGLALDEKCRPDKTCPGYCNRRKGLPNVQMMYFITTNIKTNSNQEFVTSRYEKAAEGIRFNLPGDFKVLEKLMPLSYLTQYTKLDPELRDKYTRVFREFTKGEKQQRGTVTHHNPANAKAKPSDYIDEDKIFPALDSLFANQMGKKNYVKVETYILNGEDTSKVTLDIFKGLCAFCERRIWTTYIDQNPKHKTTIGDIGCRSILEHLDFQCFMKSFLDDKALNIPIRLLHLLMSLN